MLVVALAAVLACAAAQPYNATWPSINSRPLPSWYDEAKFGIFIHWGAFSVPAFGSLNPSQQSAAEWFWNAWASGEPDFVNYVNDNFPPGWSYADFANAFTAEFWDPNAWAQLFQQSGAKYIVLTSKHHEGFTNWPSNTSWNWDSVHTGPHRDIVGELTTAVRAVNLTMGLYHSMFEWYNPNFLNDQANNFNTNTYVVEKTLPELYAIVNTYQPDVIWSDGDWMAPASYWQSTEFLAWLYNESPVANTVVVNDRWGIDCPCENGGYYTCQDRYNPGKLQNHKWENCLTIDGGSWGFRRNAPISAYLTIDQLIYELASTVSCGGNMLLNVGPNHDGTIDVIFQERLLQIGAWLDVNGPSIYSTTPWRVQNETAANVWYTQSAGTVYAIFLSWPANNELVLESPVFSAQSQVTLLGDGQPLTWTAVSGGTSIQLPSLAPGSALASQPAWALQLVGVA